MRPPVSPQVCLATSAKHTRTSQPLDRLQCFTEVVRVAATLSAIKPLMYDVCPFVHAMYDICPFVHAVGGRLGGGPFVQPLFPALLCSHTCVCLIPCVLPVTCSSLVHHIGSLLYSRRSFPLYCQVLACVTPTTNHSYLVTYDSVGSYEAVGHASVNAPATIDDLFVQLGGGVVKEVHVDVDGPDDGGGGEDGMVDVGLNHVPCLPKGVEKGTIRKALLRRMRSVLDSEGEEGERQEFDVAGTARRVITVFTIERGRDMMKEEVRV